MRGGSGESAPSDSDASSEVDRPRPEHPLPVEPWDTSSGGRGSTGSGPGGMADGAVHDALQAPGSGEDGPDRQPGPAELPWTNIDLKESPAGPSGPAAGLPQAGGLSSLGLLGGLEEPGGAADHPLWAWVSGGGCTVEAGSVLKWFSAQSGKRPWARDTVEKGEAQGPKPGVGRDPGNRADLGRVGREGEASQRVPALRLWLPAGLSPSVQTLSLSITPAQTAAWRKQIFQQLTERTKRELENFRHYEQAVEQVCTLVGPWGSLCLGCSAQRMGENAHCPPTARNYILMPSYRRCDTSVLAGGVPQEAWVPARSPGPLGRLPEAPPCLFLRTPAAVWEEVGDA